jgi:hypothetical protein
MEIKNLSIALEALSRIPGVASFSLRIEGLLDKAVAKMEEEHVELPAYSRPQPPPYRATTTDDIPF